MITHINLENIDNRHQIINQFFKANDKVKYNKKLSGKISYISVKKIP